MGLNDFPLLKAMANQMRWLVQRQQTIAQDISNVNTPKYRAQDLKTLSFKDLTKSKSATHLSSTHAAHIAPKAGLHAIPVKTYKSGKPEDMGPSGNDVNLEGKLSDMDETRHAYQLITQLYKKNVELLKIGLGNGSGQ